ncbi:hypothetical protein AYO21_11671 [Fonsecaea monophora]|uniref:Post-SET domain-containing protein n=1 Tax=Fonsecaea monophora TaxID=254056 RepID=A0A177ESY3_9EURO|nr:hypothetical protein AYO21_11671 [Fonsecaea monophora]KAH0830857.1 hypothetical protein FOPE_01959 [Fonsecaea pedrosoi]OAG34172.1 hypothetical protein AYO21_11671 [Fonsecaea monophora]
MFIHAQDTRPSTPPRNTYLRQLEEAIATPVPDLASTLNLNSTDRDAQNEEWANQPQPQPSEAQGPAPGRAGIDMILSTHAEDGEWSAESQTRGSMNNEQPGRRPPIEYVFRLPEMSGPVTENNHQLLGSTADLDLEPASLYSSRPLGYRFMSTIPQDSDDSDADILPLRMAADLSSSTNTRTHFLQLEGILQRYRSNRGAWGLSRGSDMGTVPTASALRALWNEETDEGLAVTIPSLAGLSSAQRREAVSRHAQNVQGPAGSRSAASIDAQRSDARKRVRKLICYLSRLRHTGIEGGLEAARKLGLDSLYASDDSNAPSDLPMHINSLPIPQYSSWLTAGMVWHGLQSTDRQPVRTLPPTAANIRRERQRALIRRTIARRGGASRGTGGSDEAAEFDTQALLTAERYLSDLIRHESNGRWTSSPYSNPLHTTSQPPEPDHWPVKVVIHSVDWEAMTVTGIMSASQMPEKPSSLYQSGARQPQGTTSDTLTSMSSFFVGEIIDFRRQPLETEKEGRDYEVGGVDVDARYWGRLGPFSKEIDRIRHLRGKKRTEYQQSSALWDAFRKAAAGEDAHKDAQDPSNADSPATDDTTVDDSPTKVFETPEDKEAEADEIIARSLSSAKWIEEKLGKEWILMRWKEQCFVDPPDSSTRPVFTTPTSRTGQSTGRSTGANIGGPASWGLTIAGFYYIALNRLTGEIDGLYYDPGSQPYQTIKMLPEGTTVSQSRPCGCGEKDCKDPVGIRKWFPAIELQ